jgi:putative heme-binding domain-containing protein
MICEQTDKRWPTTAVCRLLEQLLPASFAVTNLQRFLSLAFWAALLVTAPPIRAADESPKKAFFLPSNPVAAAYVLGRLSNKELAEAPRSEFVYVALLQRAGLDRKYRVEALDGLAKIRKTDPLTELIVGLGELAKKGEATEPVLRDLATVLLRTKPNELAAKRANLETLTAASPLPLSRQIGYAALMTADNSIEPAWKRAEADAAQLADVLLALPLVRDEKLRAAAYPKIEPLLHKADPAEVRRAAITAVVAVPGKETETFGTLAALMKSGDERPAAVASLLRIPRKFWPKDQVEPLLEGLLSFMPKVPVGQRTEADFVSAFQLASDLASLLPPEKSKAAHKTLRDLGVSVVVVRTLAEQMLFDKSLIVVEAGKPVEITLVNDDAMPHNLVVIAPGALEEIGEAAEKMQPDADDKGRLYVPDSQKVLHATKLVEPAQRARLSFTAPEEPGDYQFVCTFPGHWRRMVGTLAVVKDVEAYLASRAAAPEPKVTEWKLEDLSADLPKVAAGRDFKVGKELFTKLACAQCHKLGKAGSNYGPDLTDVFKRYKNDRADVLRQILEPSLVIADRYRNYEFETKDGESTPGMIVKEDADTVTIQTGPSDALIKTLKRSDIKDRVQQKSSLMPLGLLNMLTKEQILDLLAYVESGGEMETAAHKH